MSASAWPERYLSIPFREFGRDASGCDCWGLVRLVLMQECQIFLPRYDTVGAAHYAAKIERERQSPEWLKIERSDLREFDLVRMWTTIKTSDGRIRAPVHIGVMAPQRRVVHMQEGDGAVCEPLGAIAHRVVEIVRHKGLNDGSL